MKPIHGSYLFKALVDKGAIIMACNTRIIKGVTKGLFRAAKDTDSALIIELAKSECDLNGGYTGLTPADLSKRTQAIADEVGFDVWALHADHTAVKKGTDEELVDIKKLLLSCIENAYTCFSIDASHLFNFEGKNHEEELAENIRCTTLLARFIEEKYGSKYFGLEVEVGEIGRKDGEGMILTKPGEATAFIQALNGNGVYPQVLAIANGSAHGNTYDKDGNLIEQVSIDIERTKEVGQALRDADSVVRIAQHGITGTPRDMIDTKFPHKDIIKGNVGTFWQNLFWDVVKEMKPELYKEAFDWTMAKYRDEGMKSGLKNDDQIFGKFGKKATKPLFDKIYSIEPEIEAEIEKRAYEEAKKFFKAFHAEGSAQIVRDYIKELA